MIRKILVHLYRSCLPVVVRERISRQGLPLLRRFRNPAAAPTAALELCCRSMMVDTPTGPMLKPVAAAWTGLMSASGQLQLRAGLLGQSWWEDFFHAITRSNEAGALSQERLVRGVDRLSPETLSRREWMLLCRLSLKFGLFNLACRFRVQARQAAVAAISRPEADSADPADPEFRMQLAALIEAGEQDRFLHHLARLGFQAGEEKAALAQLASLAFGRPAAAVSGRPASTADGKFSAFVAGRSLAFVGPSRASTKDAVEIDGFDVVVRCNYKDPGVGVDAEIKGRRCDISYFNGTQSRFLLQRRPFRLPEGLKFVVCRAHQDHLGLRKALRRSAVMSGHEPEIRISANCSPALFAGSLNAIPNALLDLLRFAPARIKVFHADLMLTVDRFAGYNPHADDTARHMRIFINSCAGAHDPVTNHFVLKLLHDAGRVSGDAGFERAMSLSESGYMQALNDIYGNAARIQPNPIAMEQPPQTRAG